MASERSPGATKTDEPTAASARENFNKEVIGSMDLPEPVKAAFAAVDRAEFAPPRDRQHAYTDTIIGLGKNSSLSQPTLVAEMVASVGPMPGHRALEIGTATGYQASVLSQIVDHVDTIEANPKLAEQAKKNIKRLGYDGKVTVHVGDGTQGLEGQQFDNILVTAALKEMPQALLDQLAPEGIMVAPVGPNLGESILTAYRRGRDGEITTHELTACFFSPIDTEGEGGWTDEEVEKTEDDYYLVVMAAQLKALGKVPKVEIERLKAEMAETLGLEEPLTTTQMIRLGRLISDTLSQSKQEPKFEEGEADGETA